MTGSSDREGPPTKPGWTPTFVEVLAGGYTRSTMKMSWKSLCGRGVCPGVVVSLGKSSSRVPTRNTRSGNAARCKQGDREGTCDKNLDTYRKP